MTGSFVFDRQYSSTADCSIGNQMERPEFHRSLSSNGPYIFDVDEKRSVPRNQTPSDCDSGVEDSDQQNGNDESNGDFEADSDECIEENSATPVVIEEDNYARWVELGSLVPDGDKKEFCDNTIVVFHAEFARQVDFMVKSIDPKYQYNLASEEEVNSDACQWPGFGFMKLDNAKAQFRCPNPLCQRLWTSMRARIIFKISVPRPNGFIILKILGQNCENCYALADALWYMEEVCRVIKNLSDSILKVYFPSVIRSNNNLQNTTINRSFQRSRHDPNQRHGEMHAKHNRDLCEACRFGVCYA